MFISSLVMATFLVGQSAEVSAEARAWNAREDVIRDLSKDLGKTLSKNFRAVRRGVENARVAGLIQELINRANRKIKKQNAFLLVSQNGAASEKKFPLTAHEIDQALTNMDPYRREFAESCIIDKKITGSLLAGRALNLVEIPESLENKTFLDLEKFEKTGDRAFDNIIIGLKKRSGAKFYALILPQVLLPDASYSASDNFTVEQLANGDINVYQERRRPSRSEVLSIQVISVAPRNILFVGKDDLQKPLSESTAVKSVVIDTFADTRKDLLSSVDTDEEVPAPPEEEEVPGNRHRQFDVKSE